MRRPLDLSAIRPMCRNPRSERILHAAAVVLVAGLTACGARAQEVDDLLIYPRALDVAVPGGQTATRTLYIQNVSKTLLTYSLPAFAGRPASSGPGTTTYAWRDSDQPGGPRFDWTDVAAVGHPYPLDGTASPPVALPFPFPFFGTTQTYVYLSPHGFLTFSPTTDAPANERPPNARLPNGFIAPFWDALAPGAGSTLHTYAGGDRFVVQYTDMTHPDHPGHRYTFQATLYPTGTVNFQYLTVGPSDSATIGLENDLGTEGLVVAHNAAYARDGLAVRIDVVPAYVSVTPAAGTIAPGATARIDVTLDATGLPRGVYTDTLRLATSHPVQSWVALPLRLTVDGNAASPLRVSPSQLDVTLDQGSTTQRILTIENTDAGQAHAYELHVRSAASAPGHSGEAGVSKADGDASGLGVLTEVHAYASDIRQALLGATQATLTRLPLRSPLDVDVLTPMPVSYAGDFAFSDPNRLLFITHPDQALQALDLATGRRTSLGLARPSNPSQEFWTDLATDPTDGSLLGVTVNGFSRTSFLYRIDPANGAAQRVGVLPDAPLVAALAVDADGRLFGIDLQNEVLLSINKRTAATQVVGPVGFQPSGIQSMDVDLATGTLYLATFNEGPDRTELRTVDTETGETTLLAPAPAFQFGFLALPSGSFVEPNNVSGTVPPGGRQELALTFNAARLGTGRYEAALTVTTDTPAGPFDQAVPVQLTVRGDARIQLRQPTLDFGTVPVGAERSRPLFIENAGADTLRISAASFDEPAFSLSPVSAPRLPLVIPPGGDDVLSVAFQPDREGTVTGTLFIENNDPAATRLPVTLEGAGRAAPRVDLFPAAVSVDLIEGLEAERTLTLRNTGGSDLSYALRLDPDAFGEAILQPLLAEDFNRGLPASWTAVDNAGSGVTWQAHTAFPASLDYANWTGGGQAAAMVSSHATPGRPFDAALYTPPLQAPRAALTLHFRANYIDQGPDVPDGLDLDLSTDDGVTWVTLRRWNESLGRVFQGPGEAVALDLSPYLRPGDTFRLRWRYHDPRPAPGAWYAQIDDVRLTIETEVVSVMPRDGTLDPQDAVTIRLRFNAEGVRPGAYEAALHLTSDDPAASDLAIPLTLTVIEGLQVELSSIRTYPLQSVAVPLRVIGRPLPDTVAVTLAYDPHRVQAVGIATEGTLTQGAALSVDAGTPGRLHVASLEPLDLPELADGDDPNVFLYLLFEALDVPGDADLTFERLDLDGLDAPVSAVPGHITVTPLYGDATLDLAIDERDVYAVGQHARGLTPLRRPAALVAADVSGDGAVTLADPALIRRFLGGNLACFPGDPDCADPAATRIAGGLSGTAALGPAGLSDAEALPDHVTLGANYPNPSNPSTIIPYALPEATSVTLTVYNLLGQPVRILVRGDLEAGRYTATWDGHDATGAPVASGMYLLQLRAGSEVRTRRMTLIK